MMRTRSASGRIRLGGSSRCYPFKTPTQPRQQAPLSVWHLQDEAPPAAPWPFAVIPVAGKGMGVVATRSIAAGERVLAELPMLSVGEGECVDAAVDRLSMGQRTDMMSLSSGAVGGKGTASDIFDNNALPLGPTTHAAGLFLTAARFNHSCLPNVHHNWNQALGMETLHACRDIQAGEELFTSYIQLEQDRAARQGYLTAMFGFTCTCAACSLSGPALARSDGNRRALLRIAREARAAVASGQGVDGAWRAQERLELMAEEGIVDPCLLSIAEYDAYQACKQAGDHLEARRWLVRSAWHCVQAEGRDSEDCTAYARMLLRPVEAPHDICSSG